MRFALFVAAQVLVFNHINLGGFVNAWVYVIFILMLPFDTPGWLRLMSSFLMGLSVDIFAQTPGLHATAATLAAFIRPAIMRSIASNKEIEPGLRPTLFDMGARWYFLYAFIMIMIHHIFLFYFEILSFHHFFDTLLQACLSGLLTLGLSYLSQYLFYYKKK